VLLWRLYQSTAPKTSVSEEQNPIAVNVKVTSLPVSLSTICSGEIKKTVLDARKLMQSKVKSLIKMIDRGNKKNG